MPGTKGARPSLLVVDEMADWDDYPEKGATAVKAVMRDTRAGRQAAAAARPLSVDRPRPPSRGRYEDALIEASRLLEHLRRPDLSEHELRSFTIRMARLQRDLASLKNDVDALELLADQVVSLVVKHSS